jgi:hypothetical protein
MGPVVVGACPITSPIGDVAAGAEQMTEAFKAVGLHDAMYLIPVALFLTMVFLFLASRCFVRDAKRMKEGLGSGSLMVATA